LEVVETQKDIEMETEDGDSKRKAQPFGAPT
jgi:hypothetical protein